ncbi:MAG TPA: glucose-6-phosphate dehydrogenase assembly protein OpcA [Acidimicrobiales bacterium]|nr:glucose-6-phosphate dehydrogenase assembly protein OpcA [Acidimicrobiales bacterium]
MAEPVAHGEIGTWRGADVRIGQVLDALTDLRRCEQRTATRASVTNLVLVAGDEAEVESACEAVHRLGRRHPGRAIVVLASPGAEPSGIDAEVVLHGSVLEGHPVWSEDVRLVVRGGPTRHLQSLVEPLTLPDLPVAVWFVSGVPDPHDPLVRGATTLVVDGDTFDADTAVAAMARLAGRRVVYDLCWERLRPWRQSLAGVFEVPDARPFVAGARRIEVEGPPWPSLLLGGWAASRLGLPAAAVRRASAAASAIRLVAEHGGEVATFAAEQVEDAGGAAVVRATSSIASHRRSDRVALSGDPVAWALGEALTRTDRDRVHGLALQAAVAIARQSG